MKPNAASPEDFELDDRVYNKHTQRDLIACVSAALDWAIQQKAVAPEKGVIFSGHSEGAQVLARLYLDTLKKSPSKAALVRHLILSGLPMQSWKDIIDFQRSGDDRVQFWDAFNRRDDQKMRQIGNLASAYFEDIFSTEPLRQTLEQLARLSPAARFHFFQEDLNTPPGPVMSFEKWNLEQLLADKPGLRLSARYYNAAHGLNLSAANDEVFLLLTFLGL